ncbi:hypothetical protein Malapachy_2396 [Malassezia pachydermatis]|uniref:BCD1 alpha/beta domain-containing protein n=1 Tax=Malassezia pachydermatis TaxID=77020 RepID=A0A0M8MS22_9BASI|nr:hypothetical protein Malapachy_2396 [Malassezia pachydermatis]KOS15627.1 hypothetical protein Malapachy_2396 [Malassezia pachydermatis]
MKEYDYNQMLEDYQFLNQVGRMVTERGRELSNGKMLAPEKPAAGPSSRHGPAAQQRREALGKQIAFHKLPIMLVPDGMSRRKQNRSHWDAKQRRMLFTIQFHFPCQRTSEDATIARAQAQGILVHSLEGPTCLSHVCLTELERLSARVHHQSVTAWHARITPDERPGKRARMDDMSHRMDRVSHHGPWHLAPDVMASLGLPHAPNHALSLPASSALVLHVYPLRLRNESSVKYLDWWARKGAMQEAAATPATVSTSEAMSKPSLLVPQHILDQVSQLRADPSTVVDSPLTSSTTQYYVLVPSEMDLLTLIRRIPSEFGMVEFADLELWHTEALTMAERRGQVVLLPLGPAPSTPTDTTTPAPTSPEAVKLAAMPTLVAYTSSDSEGEAE